MTFEDIRWCLHVRAPHETKVRRVLDQVADTLRQPVSLESIEKYWKIPGQYVAVFRTPLYVGTPQEAVFETLRSCQLLGQGWCVGGPHALAEHGWEFEATCGPESGTGFSVAGPVWAHVSVSNVDPFNGTGVPLHRHQV